MLVMFDGMNAFEKDSFPILHMRTSSLVVISYAGRMRIKIKTSQVGRIKATLNK
jgi:hypothetical protein